MARLLTCVFHPAKQAAVRLLLHIDVDGTLPKTYLTNVSAVSDPVSSIEYANHGHYKKSRD